VGPGGETLKVTAPNPLAPANGSTLTTFSPNLQVSASTPKFQGSGKITHRFQLLNGSTVLRDFATGGTTWVPTGLLNKTTYGWRARGEQGALYGPWSATWTFITPDQPEGYSRPGELYDPLFNGKTIGAAEGGVTLIRDVGARMQGFTSHIRYQLSQTLTAGEFSMLVTGVLDNTEGRKTKMMSMSEGLADVTTDNRRFTLERRGNSSPPGVVAWRMITSDDQIETDAGTRRYVRFTPNQTYLVRSAWGGGNLTITIREGGAAGHEIYRMSHGYSGVYDPSPHYAFVGCPVPRGGPEAATIPGMTVRQVWISNHPRPEFANR